MEASKEIRRTHPAWHLLGAGLVLAWLLVMARLAGWLGPAGAPESLDFSRLAGTLGIERQAFMVFVAERRAGWATSSLQPDGDGFRLSQRLRLRLRLAGRTMQLQSELVAGLDRRGGLREFDYRLQGAGIGARVTGNYRQGELTVSGELAGRKLAKRLPLDEAPLLDALLPRLLARQRLEPGRRYRVRVFDPRLPGNRWQELEMLGQEPLKTQRGLLPAFHLRSGGGELASELWIDERGNLLRQQTGFGLRLEAAPPGVDEPSLPDSDLPELDAGQVWRWLGKVSR